MSNSSGPPAKPGRYQGSFNFSQRIPLFSCLTDDPVRQPCKPAPARMRGLCKCGRRIPECLGDRAPRLYTQKASFPRAWSLSCRNSGYNRPGSPYALRSEVAPPRSVRTLPIRCTSRLRSAVPRCHTASYRGPPSTKSPTIALLSGGGTEGTEALGSEHTTQRLRADDSSSCLT